MNVRCGRFHPAQPEEAVLLQRQPGREADVQHPLVGTCDVSDGGLGRTVGQRRPEQPGCGALVRRGQQRDAATLVDVGVARAGVRRRRRGAARRRSSGRGRPRAPRPGRRGPGSPSGRCRLPTPRARCPRSGSRGGRGSRSGTSAGAARSRPGGRPAPPRRPETPRASTGCTRDRGAAPRPAAACRCLAPAGQAGRRTWSGTRGPRAGTTWPSRPSRSRSRPPSSPPDRGGPGGGSARPRRRGVPRYAATAAGRRSGACACPARRTPRR